MGAVPEDAHDPRGGPVPPPSSRYDVSGARPAAHRRRRAGPPRARRPASRGSGPRRRAGRGRRRARAAATPAPLRTSGARDWMTSSEPCSPDVAALVGEPVPRGVHDGEVRAAGRVGEQRQDPLGRIRVGVVDRPARAGRRDLPRRRAGRPSGPRWRTGSTPSRTSWHTAGVQPHPAEVVGGVRHGPAVASSTQTTRSTTSARAGRGQRLDDGAAAGGDIGGSRGAHGPDSRAWRSRRALTPDPEPVAAPPARFPGQARLRGRRRRRTPDPAGSTVPRLEGCTGVPRGRHRRWCCVRPMRASRAIRRELLRCSSAVRRSVAPAFVRERGLRS